MDCDSFRDLYGADEVAQGPGGVLAVRRAMPHEYRELEHGLGPDHFEGHHLPSAPARQDTHDTKIETDLTEPCEGRFWWPSRPANSSPGRLQPDGQVAAKAYEGRGCSAQMVLPCGV